MATFLDTSFTKHKHAFIQNPTRFRHGRGVAELRLRLKRKQCIMGRCDAKIPWRRPERLLFAPVSVATPQRVCVCVRGGAM